MPSTSPPPTPPATLKTRFLLPCPGAIPPYLTPSLLELFEGRKNVLCLTVDVVNSCVSRFEEGFVVNDGGDGGKLDKTETIASTNTTTTASTPTLTATPTPNTNPNHTNKKQNPKNQKKSKTERRQNRGYTFTPQPLLSHHKLPIDIFDTLIVADIELTDGNSTLVHANSGGNNGGVGEKEKVAEVLPSSSSCPALSIQTKTHGRQVLSVNDYAHCVLTLLSSGETLFPTDTQKTSSTSTSTSVTQKELPNGREREHVSNLGAVTFWRSETTSTSKNKNRRSVERSKTFLLSSISALNPNSLALQSGGDKVKVWGAVLVNEDDDVAVDVSIRNVNEVADGLDGVVIIGLSNLDVSQRLVMLRKVMRGLHARSPSSAPSTPIAATVIAIATTTTTTATTISTSTPSRLKTAVLNTKSLSELVDCVLEGVDYVGTEMCWKMAMVGEGFDFDFDIDIEDKGGDESKKKLKNNNGTSSSTSTPSSKNQTYKNTIRNLKSPLYTLDTQPLSKKCKCMACAKHTRAYVHHLLNCNELLGQILLFVHNLWGVLDFVESVQLQSGEVERGEVWRDRVKGW